MTIKRLCSWRWETNVALATLLLIIGSIPHIAASAEYGESEDTDSDAMSKYEDIYYPAVLQQDFEANERKSIAEHIEMDAQTELSAAKDVRNISSNHISSENMSLEHENMTEEEDAGDSADYDENLSMATQGATATTTMIPTYVRKAKAESFASAAKTKAISEDEAQENVSSSDYVDDSAGAKTAKHDVYINDDDDIVPLAMKFYQNNDRADGDVNRLQAQQPIVPLPQQQLLPNIHNEQPFREHNNFSSSGEEEYYIDDAPAIGVKTTSAPAIDKATLAPNLAIARAAIPNGLPFQFIGGGLWTTAPTITQAAATTTTLIAPTAPTQLANGLTESSATPAAPTIITTTTAATITTLRPAGKQGKQIKISRRKLLPHEQLRNYIEDAYIRMPLAVIVDPSAESLEKTKALWRDALRTNINIKIVLVSLNASGVPAAYNFNNTRQFLAGLSSIKEHGGGNAFVGIVHASELVPYDSAVFISTAALPPHTELVQDAAITLLKKRIRLYLLWYGERAISENETQEAVGGILGEVAIRSGGEILHIVGSENSQELEGSTLTLVADAFQGAQELEIPVDTTLSSLHVKIDKPMRLATLETPNGDINLKKLVKFKSRIFTLGADDKRLDAYVPLTKLRKASTFKLKMLPEYLDDEYSVFVRADRKADLFLDDMIKRFDSYFMEGISAYPTRFHDSRLQSITAALAAATAPTHDNLKFPDDAHKEINEFDYDDNAYNAPKSEVETLTASEILNSTATKNTAALGSIGNTRATNVLQMGVTRIEMSVQSQVLIAPGMMGQLVFELTNTRSEAIYHSIQVVDERRFLLRLAPQSVFLRAGETAIVTVTVLVPTGTAEGTIDRITFTCHGGGTASLSLNLKVITSVDAQDTTPPTITWEFGNRCDKNANEAATCAERFWTIDITAQDWQTGIMRLQSTPAGLVYRNTYTVGGTEPLKATYIATCCEPKVALIAYDIAGNQRSYTIDVRDIVLTEASIAAIVLGVILLIILIILLIWAIVWCCRRRKVSLDLPTYRSHSTRSME